MARLPVLPLRDVVVYPHVVMPLLVGRAASLTAIEAAMKAEGALLLVSQRSADVEDPSAADLYRVGVVARIAQVSRQPNGTARLLIEGIARSAVKRFSRNGGMLTAVIDDE